MTRLLGQHTLEQAGSNTVVSFTTQGTENWPAWNRFLCIEGKPAYEIGNICNTCAFYFERLDGASQSIHSHAIIEHLNHGLGALSPDAVASVLPIIPSGRYHVALLEVFPKLVTLGGAQDYFAQEQVALWGVDGFYGLPHHPKVPYYRGTDTPLQKEQKAFEFLVPMFPPSWLDTERVAHYRTEIEKGGTPTAVALSVLDVKGPAWLDESGTIPPYTEHWCLAHYLLDGHHKMYAASLLQKPIHLLAFIALDECIMESPDDVATLLTAI
ncbi:hypothetical protein GCM10027511_14760 [Hymenobacter humi]